MAADLNHLCTVLYKNILEPLCYKTVTEIFCIHTSLDITISSKEIEW